MLADIHSVLSLISFCSSDYQLYVPSIGRISTLMFYGRVPMIQQQIVIVDNGGNKASVNFLDVKCDGIGVLYCSLNEKYRLLVFFLLKLL